MQKKILPANLDFFQKLPSMIIVNILEYLTTQEIERLKLINKALYHFIIGDNRYINFFWQKKVALKFPKEFQNLANTGKDISHWRKNYLQIEKQHFIQKLIIQMELNLDALHLLLQIHENEGDIDKVILYKNNFYKPIHLAAMLQDNALLGTLIKCNAKLDHGVIKILINEQSQKLDYDYSLYKFIIKKLLLEYIKELKYKIKKFWLITIFPSDLKKKITCS